MDGRRIGVGSDIVVAENEFGKPLRVARGVTTGMKDWLRGDCGLR